MRSVNKVILIGHLTRDPELRQTSSGHPVATFSIATNRYWTTSEGDKQESTEFHDLVAWGKLAEICHEHLNKGCAIYVEGRLHTRSWEGPDGQKRHKTEVVVNELNILARKAAEGKAEEISADIDNVLSVEKKEGEFGSELDLDLNSGGLPGEDNNEEKK